MSEASSTTCPDLAELERASVGGGDEAAIRAHIEVCESCRELMGDLEANRVMLQRIERSHAGDLFDTSDAPDATAPGLGDIEGYEISEEIHRGGQGVVYRAVQRATNRTVAIKVLLAGSLATSRQRARFEREIELVAHLSHPNIVTVFDSGSTGDGHTYLVMEHIEGQPLDQWLDVHQLVSASKGRRDPRQIVKLFGRVCNGVTHAHQHGVIHRDLKPANILIDERGQPRILDFGLAKELLDASPESRHASRDGEFMGTLAYAAPEQTAGDPAQIDVRTDVYALGVMLYQALTGSFPYSVDGPLSAVLERIREHEPGRMTGDTDDRVRVDADLETIVRTALAKDKERRYQSVAALQKDLHHWMQNEPIDARRDSGWYVLSKTLRKHRAAAASGLAFLLMLLVFSVAMSVAYNRARTEANKVRQINVFLEDTLGSVQAGEEGREVTVRELLDEAVQWIEIALSDQPEVAASIQSTTGNGYRNLGLYEQAEAQLQRALATRRDLFGDDDPQVAHSLSQLALVARDRGNLEEADRLFSESLDIRRRLLGENTIEVSINLANLGLIKRDMGAFDDAERLLQESLDIRRLIYGERHSDVAMCLFNLASVAQRRGDVETAIGRHREALQLRRIVVHQKHPDLARSLLALARLLMESDRAAEAEPLLIECVEHRRAALPAGDRGIREAEGELARCQALLDEAANPETGHAPPAIDDQRP